MTVNVVFTEAVPTDAIIVSAVDDETGLVAITNVADVAPEETTTV
jgi:hypothetical protein